MSTKNKKLVIGDMRKSYYDYLPRGFIHFQNYQQWQADCYCFLRIQGVSVMLPYGQHEDICLTDVIFIALIHPNIDENIKEAVWDRVEWDGSWSGIDAIDGYPECDRNWYNKVKGTILLKKRIQKLEQLREAV